MVNLKKFKKLNKYYKISHLVELFKLMQNSDIFFFNLNSYKHIHLFLLLQFCKKHNFELHRLKPNLVKHVLSLKQKSNLNLFKNVNYVLIKSNEENLPWFQLLKLNNFDCKQSEFDNMYINFICIKLSTHNRLCTLPYLIQLLNKYGFDKKVSAKRIILLLKFTSIKLLKILKFKNTENK